MKVLMKALRRTYVRWVARHWGAAHNACAKGEWGKALRHLQVLEAKGIVLPTVNLLKTRVLFWMGEYEACYLASIHAFEEIRNWKHYSADDRAYLLSRLNDIVPSLKRDGYEAIVFESPDIEYDKKNVSAKYLSDFPEPFTG